MATKRCCSIDGCQEEIGRHGARGMCVSHYRNLIRRGNPLLEPTRRSPGMGWIHSSGYRGFTKGVIRKFEHVEKAEKAIGMSLPYGAVVHHVDDDPLNNGNSNLVICPNQKYHMLLHVRTRAYSACGNASWRKCKVCKTHDDPKNLRFWGNEVMHLACSSQKQRNRIALMKGR